MAKIPVQTAPDPTLAAIDKAMELAAATRGMSAKISCGTIGKECSREIWYAFRWAKKEAFKASTLRIFEDGFAQEDLMAKRLRMVDGIELHTIDPATGKQIQHYDLDGHLTGKQDGAIVGVIQAPKTWHVWEHKAVNEKKFSELKKLMGAVGEKNALLEWDAVYYTQHQLYMHYCGFERGYLTCTTPGGRDYIACRTNYDQEFCLRVIAKAQRIAGSQHPLEKISNKEDAFVCRFCTFSGICHKGEWAERNCRTCLHASPAPGGKWRCERWAKELDYKEQQQGCPVHKYIPSLVPGKQVDAGPTWVSYQMPDGTMWHDTEEGKLP